MQRSFAHLCRIVVALSAISVASAGDGDAKAAPVKLSVEPRSDITSAEIEAHVRFLASDELAGRFTGSDEADRAARYIALVLEKEGVQPAGDGGTYFQDVPMTRSRPRAVPELKFTDRAGETVVAVHGRDFEAGDEIALESVPVIVATTEAAIPHEGDRKSALFVDAPASKRRQWLANAGHPGGEGFAVLIEAGSDQPGVASDELPDVGPPVRTRRDGERTPRIRVRGTLLASLRKGDVARLTIASHVEREPVHGANVVGKIQGASDEAVVLSAHYDHLDSHRSGSHASADAKDTIFNGADDDASGVATVLELAGALAAGSKPQRTIVFLLVTGEEIGLLGTSEYLDRPVVPLEKTVANVNFEMLGRPDPLVGGAGVLWLTGHELTNLGPAWTAAGLPVKPDMRPDEHFFQRSDNYAFVMRGVVGQTLSTYNMHTDYHTPSDEADRLDYAHMETCTTISLEAVRTLTEGRLRPAWLPGKEPKKR